ncbi:MAG: ATP-binding protein [Phaeodactylibacter sp.]|nr:ATP-binding protein [Phaeodactylibacter sp.]
MTNTLQFKISASLKNIIGKDLITDDYIAIFELVKNAYDAYAKKVTISFEEDRITIVDDGKGMDYSDIVNKWLFVAYSAKKEGTEDEDILKEEKYKNYRDKINEKKSYAGAKGIGRFSCDRLGRMLTMYTRKVNTPTVEKLVVNWEKFEEDSKKEFVNIHVFHEALDPSSFPNLEYGTILQIEGLHSDWSRSKLLDLKQSLEKLINPLGQITSKKSKNDFKIFIEAERELREDQIIKDKIKEDEGNKGKYLRETVNGEVKNFIFEILNVKTTQIVTKIEGESIFTEMVDRGTLIYKIREKNPYNTLKEGVFNFHLFFLNRKAKVNFTRLMGVRTVDFGSIFLFKNGFRIYPYGNVGDDSFQIDRDKAQQGSRALGSRELIGRIELIGETTNFNFHFRETSSRDGLVQTDGVQQLVLAFREKCLRRLEKYVVEVPKGLMDSERLQDSERDDTKGLENIESKERIIDLVYKLVTNKTETVELVEYNKTFLNIVDEKLEAASPEAFSKLSAIAARTNDKSFFEELAKVKEKHIKLIQDKEAAERRAEEEEKARLKAEQEREEARQREEEEKQKRKEAELKAIAEKQRRKDAELREKEAELRVREARVLAEEEAKRRQDAEDKLVIEKNKNIYLLATRKTLSDDAEGLIHNIKFSSNKIRSNVDILIDKIRNNEVTSKEMLRRLGIIKVWSDKALKISELITRANFATNSETQIIDIVKYTEQYFELFSELYEKTQLKFEVRSKNASLERRIGILDLSVVFDNFIFNAEKAGASKVMVECSNPSPNTLSISISDNGHGVKEMFLSQPEKMFELGVTTTDGSGIGLASVRDTLKQLNAKVEFIGNGINLKGATFQINFK